MSPKEYEDAILELARDLRMHVATNIDESLSDHSYIVEITHNAADLLLHNLTVVRMVRAILQDGGGDSGTQLRALDRVMDAAQPPCQDQFEMHCELAGHRLPDTTRR